MSAPRIVIGVMAHNEERRIARCLASLPLGQADVTIHVIVNGSSDRTAEIASGIAARHGNVVVHNWEQGGKARSWNRFVFETITEAAPVHVFVDGDAEVAPGSIAALAEALAGSSGANAASALPRNGRLVERYRQSMLREYGLFGDLYALSGDFVRRLRQSGLRLPVDLVGDDGLIGALAKTDLGHEDNWRDERVAVVGKAGFYCEPVSLLRAASWVMQYNRMVSYSLRYFQNLIISRVMRGPGPEALPEKVAAHYAEYRHMLTPRGGITGYFDRKALARIDSVIAAQGKV